MPTSSPPPKKLRDMEERKNNTGLVVLVTVLVMLVIGMGAFIIYDKVINKTNEPNIEENNEEKKELKEISINDKLITTLKYPMDNFGLGYKTNWDYKNIIIDNLSRADMMYTAEYDLEPIRQVEPDAGLNDIYSAIQIENNFKKIFGPDIKYYNGDIEDGDYDCGHISEYNKDDNTYIAYGGCGGDTLGYIERISVTYKAEKTDEYIYVYDYVQSVIIRPEDENDYNSDPAAYLLDHNDKETTKIEYDNYENTIYSMIDKNEVDTYKWTFKKQSDGNYYFYSGAWEN